MKKIKLVSGKEVTIGKNTVYWVHKDRLTIESAVIYFEHTIAIYESVKYSQAFATLEEAEEWLENYKIVLKEGKDIIEKYQKISDQSKEFDSVNKPKHYQLFPDKDIEVIDVIDMLIEKASKILTPKQLTYYSHMMGYFMRFGEKNGMEDFKKGGFYYNRIIDQSEEK